MVEAIFHLAAIRCSPFEQQELAPQLHTTSPKRMTAATTADYSDTGPENAKMPVEFNRAGPSRDAPVYISICGHF